MTDIIQSVGQLAELGTKGLLLTFLIVIWRDKKEMEKAKDQRDTSQTNIIRELYNRNFEIIKENTEQSTALKGAIEKNSIVLENNTRIQESLTEKIYQVLARK
jgi:hypothetical protein